MKLISFITLTSTAMGFSFQSTVQTSKVVLQNSVDETIGVTPPLGLYDPLGWLTKDPAESFAPFHASFERRRAVERKHGRVAMMAVVGESTPSVQGKQSDEAAHFINYQLTPTPPPPPHTPQSPPTKPPSITPHTQTTLQTK